MVCVLKRAGCGAGHAYNDSNLISYSAWFGHVFLSLGPFPGLGERGHILYRGSPGLIRVSWGHGWVVACRRPVVLVRVAVSATDGEDGDHRSRRYRAKDVSHLLDRQENGQKSLDNYTSARRSQYIYAGNGPL